MFTYALILISMAYVTNISYGAAFRQISIPLGAILGIVILKEQNFKPKLAGIAIVFLGVVLVGTG